MNKQLMKRCWRIALAAYQIHVRSHKPVVYPLRERLPDFDKLQQVVTTIHQNYERISKSKCITQRFITRLTHALDDVREHIIVDKPNHLKSEAHWVTNFALGLYRLVTLESVTLSVKGDPEISFVVEDVEIEEILLGDFRVIKSLLHPTETQVKSILNPGMDVPHPHIRDTSPCLGDAAATLAYAWEEGDIASVIDIFEAYLRSYNERSAYKRIYEIFGYICKACGHQDEEMDTCNGCDETCCCMTACDECESDYLCGDCSRLSDCNDCNKSICNDCCNSCETCGDVFCRNHINLCDECNIQVCEHCTVDGLCVDCKASVVAEEEKKEETDVAAE